LALRAQALIDEGKLVDSSDLKPDYLRPSQAERERANASL
jgi:tRNA threonylcarbamoyladenosine biosynthesis protein TsaB